MKRCDSLSDALSDDRLHQQVDCRESSTLIDHTHTDTHTDVPAAFIKRDMWPPNSPDLNPVNYAVLVPLTFYKVM